MNVETRGRAAAAGLRSATSIDVEAGLSRLRRTRRQRDVGRLIVACTVVAAVVGGAFLAIDRQEKVAPVEHPQVRNGPIINAGEHQVGIPSTLPSERPYPLWQGVDPDSGSFLYTLEAEGRLAIVDESGPVAEIDCPLGPEPRPGNPPACELGPYPGEVAFGPGDDELTFIPEPAAFDEPRRTLLIVGYDGEVREELDLPDAALPDGVVKLIAWSPDGRQLAVAMEDQDSGPGEVWIISRGRSEARLAYREEAREQLVEGRYVNSPVMVDLAWSPDGGRLGILVAYAYQRDEGQPGDPSHPLPRLITVPAGGGEAQTLHTFGFRDPRSTVPGNYIRNWAFAWSPDGQRIAVTSKGGIAEISASDGTVLAEHSGVNDYGPLAWLPE